MSGVFLGHRLSRDIDLVCHQRVDLRGLSGLLSEVAAESGGTVRLVQDAGTFVRGELRLVDAAIDVDLLFEGAEDLQPATNVEGVQVESLTDLRAAKLTCLLSRSEPRDLVDLLFLDRAGYPPEQDLPLAVRKDAGIDAGVMAWLLGQFPVEPLPQMLAPLSVEELRQFRTSCGSESGGWP